VVDWFGVDNGALFSAALPPHPPKHPPSEVLAAAGEIVLLYVSVPPGDSHGVLLLVLATPGILRSCDVGCVYHIFRWDAADGVYSRFAGRKTLWEFAGGRVGRVIHEQ
jgi:hypothetical protein